jgi:O-antigen/teichoic acid export membrane protein
MAASAMTLVLGMDLGLALATQRFASSLVVGGSRVALYRSINSALLAGAALSAPLMVILVAIGYILPLFGGVGPADARLFQQLLWILAVCVPVQMVRYPFQGLIIAMQEHYKLVVLNLVGQLVYVGVTVAAFWLGWQDLRALAVATVADHLVLLAGTLAMAWGRVRLIPLSRRLMVRREVARLLRFGMEVFPFTLASILMYELDNLLIGGSPRGGSQQVAYYSIPMLIALQLRLLGAGVSGPLLAVASQLRASNQLDLLVNLFLSSARAGGVLMLAVLGPLVIFGRAFIGAWLGPDMAWTWVLLAVAGVGQLAWLVSYPGQRMLVGSGTARLPALAELAGALFKLAAAVAVVVTIGPNLMALAALTSLPLVIVGAGLTPWSICRQNGIPLAHYLAQTFGRLAISAVVPTALLLVLRWVWTPQTLKMALVQVAVGAMVFTLAGWWVALTDWDRKYLRTLLGRPAAAAATNSCANLPADGDIPPPHEQGQL